MFNLKEETCLIYLFLPHFLKSIKRLGKFLLLSWTYLFILILGRFKVEVYSGANFQIVEPIASVKKCKCQWKDDAWDFVNLRHGIQCLFRIIHSPSDAPLTPQCTVENQTRNSKLIKDSCIQEVESLPPRRQCTVWWLGFE